MPSAPTLVFIPGAWHKPTGYNRVINILESEFNLKCKTVTLPSTLGDPNATFKDDRDAAAEVINSETSSGRNVLLVAHSYGGAVANSALKGFTQHSHLSASPSTEPVPTKSGHVLGLVLIASGFSLTGFAFMALLLNRPPPTWRANTSTGFADIVMPPREFFYHDLDPKDAEHWAAELCPQSLKALFEGGEYVYSGWRDVPVWYLGTTEDRGLPVAIQRVQVGMAWAMGASVTHVEVGTSHSPFLSVPRTTAGWLGSVVESVSGESVSGGAVGGREEETRVVKPRIGFVDVGSWVRYGLPYGFGWAVGKLILGLQWVGRWRRS
ncbi:Alpha/Beta hydrolase protein [Pyrenochaeta sp. MPI-SDFR-AT-0127]|nr:Alpha/Beta hydrolase protein [Pyrenochaeta sp. MPI-SDFR-AT-0127]